MDNGSSIVVAVNLKKLLIVLAVIVPILLLDMFLVLDRSRDALKSEAGAHFETIAKMTASETSRWVHARVLDVRTVAANADVRRVVTEANVEFRRHNENAMRSRLGEIDRDWNTPKVAAVVTQLLTNPASVHLRELVALNPSFQRFLVTDAFGRAVAGSHKTADYYQGDEGWWQASFRDGRTGAIHIRDADFDVITRIHHIRISAPISDEGAAQVIGVVAAIVDLAALAPITGQARFGKTGEAILAKAEGTILSAHNPALVMKAKAPEIEAIRERGDRSSGYLSTTLPGGAQRFIGFAQVGLDQAFSGLQWTLIVSSDLGEATAPITVVHNRALASAFLGIFLVTMVAVYFSLHRPQKLTDIAGAGPG